jgi:subtilisin-like proprotein convertase family protein
LTSVSCTNGASTGSPEQFVASGLTAGDTYYLRVYQHPSGAGGTPVSNSQFSICVYAPLPGCPATFTPANSATPCPSATATTLSWTAATNATGYDVYFDAGAGPATTLVSPDQAGLTYNAGVLASGQYSWRIEAKNGNGTTICSNLTFTVNVAPTVNITPAGPISICAPATQLLSLGTTSAATPTYQWQNNSVNIVGQTGTTYTATASGNYRLVVTDGVTGCSGSSNAVSVTINPIPGAITITPASATICPTGPAQLLTASGGAGGAGVSGSPEFSSGLINLLIPDTQVPATDTLANTLVVSGVPVGASLDSVIVTLNITHPFDGDLDIYLQGPNGQIMELSTDNGSTGDDYTNTRITTDAAAPTITLASAPFTGTFRAEGYLNAGNLASLLNGGWVLKIYDDASGDQGTLVDWSIKVAYTQPSYVWTPNGAGNGLYTDAGATILYSGGPTSTVYALSTGNTTYTATVTSGAGCSSSANAVITVLPANTLEWTGAINTDWTNPGNWTCNTVPTITSNVIINAGVPNYPVITLNVEIKSLTAKPGSSVTVNTGFELKLNGL